MTPQPQYIITKEDYDQIYCIQYPLTSEERRRICERSRPAASPNECLCDGCEHGDTCPRRWSHPAPSSAHVVITETKNKITCDHCGKIVEYLNSWTYRNEDGIKRYLCSERCYDLESDKQHDATIRNDFLEKAEHLAQTIPDFNRMDYIHLLKESLRSREGGDE